MAVGIAVLVTNAAAAGWGAVGWLRHNARAAIAFWPLLRVAQATVVIQAVIGLLLLARGESRAGRAARDLRDHAAVRLADQRGDARRGGAARAGGRRGRGRARRAEQVTLARKVALGEMGVMTVGALLILTLALRAYQTGG